jgi:catechol 2,3-dioxygenase-like lactoylglutathione lyase family enzyme
MTVISGFHTIIYSDDSEATRNFLRDVLGWPAVDAGGGWLIFKTPPSELGVHPTQDAGSGDRGATVPFHQASLMCDDIHAAITELEAKGVAVKRGIEDQGFGLVTSFEVPGAGWMLLYQPRHPVAHNIDD